MATKSRFIGVRFEPEQQRKLILLSLRAGDPGNMSAGLRYAVDRIAVSGSINAEIAENVAKTIEEKGAEL